MRTLPQLKRIAAEEGVPLGIIEKDYALSVALNALAAEQSSKKLIFKGGTAIRKIYFNDARFSEDLDFTAPDSSSKDIMRLLKETFERKTLEGVEFSQIEEEQTTAGLKASIKYDGPTKYKQRIRFDFSFRGNLAGKPSEKQMLESYGLSGGEMMTLELGEIFAEKIHALSSRSAPRDLYDVWFLIKKGVSVDSAILERKFSYYGERYETAEISSNIATIEPGWSRDLKPLLKKLPPFHKVSTEVQEKLQIP